MIWQGLYINMEGLAENLALPDLPNSIQELDQILELGYEAPDIYAWKAEIHFHHSNYGLALENIEKSISITDRNDHLFPKFLELQAVILSRVRSRHDKEQQQLYEKAYRSLRDAQRISGKKKPLSPLSGYIAYGFDREIMYSYVLDHVYRTGSGDTDWDNQKDIRKIIIQELALWYGKVSENFPLLEGNIREIVGEEFWQGNRDCLV